MTQGAKKACGLILAGHLVALAGCIVIPIPVNYHASGSRMNVNQLTASRLQPGVSTKEDVLLLLGEPDYCSQDGQTLGYSWTKVGLLLIVGTQAGGGETEIGKNCMLEIAFDATNRVAFTELHRKLWSDSKAY